MAKFNKNSKISLSKSFNSNEFDCSCVYDSCVEQVVSDSLINKLQKVRDEFGFPIRITSGFRCSKKQQDLRGQGHQTAKGVSTHEKGEAVDIQPVDKTKHQDLLPVLEKYFKSIGLAKTFYHVDLREDKQRRWNYI